METPIKHKWMTLVLCGPRRDVRRAGVRTSGARHIPRPERV
jgi:hypothetical protein